MRREKRVAGKWSQQKSPIADDLAMGDFLIALLFTEETASRMRRVSALNNLRLPHNLLYLLYR